MSAKPPTIERRSVKVDLRVSPAAKAKLQSAASSLHRSLTDFVMESALARAEETLADRRIFVLDPDRWAEFQAALDKPVQPLPRLRRLLEKPGFFATK